MGLPSQFRPPFRLRVGHTGRMRRPRLESTFARAVVPVAAGIAFFAVLGLALWGVAALISGDSSATTDRLTPTIQELGPVQPIAEAIALDGPIVLNDLVGNDRHIVLDHTGDEADRGWAMYLAHPADRTVECPVAVVRGSRNFTDCEGRTLTVDDLALPPAGVSPIVNNDGTLSLDLTSD